MRPIGGRFVLFSLLGFFGAVLAVNATFIALSRSSWPGLSEESAYAHGIAFNSTLQEERQQRARGWSLTLEQEGRAGLALNIRDAAGKPVTGLVPTVELRAFGHPDQDQTILLQPAGSGLYRAPVALAAQRWQAIVAVRDGSGAVVFRTVQELPVQP